MKCQYTVERALGVYPAVLRPTCPNDAVWNERCQDHGGRHPTVAELMSLLAELTDQGDQSLSVRVGYKRMRVFTAQDDSHLDDKTWGYVVSTRISGQDQSQDASAQGEGLEQALWALCMEVTKRAEAAQERVVTRATKARDGLARFVASRDPYR